MPGDTGLIWAVPPGGPPVRISAGLSVRGSVMTRFAHVLVHGRDRTKTAYGAPVPSWPGVTLRPPGELGALWRFGEPVDRDLVQGRRREAASLSRGRRRTCLATWSPGRLCVGRARQRVESSQPATSSPRPKHYPHPPCRFCAADICAGYAGLAAQINQIWTPSSASQVVERGERAVDDLGAWQRAGQRGDLVEDVSARLLADLLLELSVALYVLARHGGR